DNPLTESDWISTRRDEVEKFVRDENIILTDETIRKFYFLTKDIEKENEYLSLDDLNKFRLLIFAFTH
ncbi:hypothetical protein ACQKFQ_11410, partial [Staphylococcus capitis]